MLSKLRCPHTGLVNFFTDVDPYMSVGSIIATAPSRYVWRCHLVEHRCGVTADPMSVGSPLVLLPHRSRRNFPRPFFFRRAALCRMHDGQPAGSV